MSGKKASSTCIHRTLNASSTNTANTTHAKELTDSTGCEVDEEEEEEEDEEEEEVVQEQEGE